MAKTVNEILEQDNRYAQFLVDSMLKGIIDATPRNSVLAYHICSGIEQNFSDIFDLIDIKFPNKKKKKGCVYSGIPSGEAVDQVDWDNIKKYSDAQVNFEPPEEDIFTQNVRRIQPHLGLSDIEADVLIYVHAIKSAGSNYMTFIHDLMKASPDRFPAFVALALGKPNKLGEISKAIGITGKLASYGIIRYYDEEHDQCSIPVVEEGIKITLSESSCDFEQLTRQIVGKPTKAKLSIEKNYRHIDKKIQKIIDILKEAQKRKLKGVNIAIYGPAGSGKTELAKAIAEAAGLTAYAIGEDEASNMRYDSRGNSTHVDSMKRLASLRQAQVFLRNNDNSLLIMDEVEDLRVTGKDSGDAENSGSKILLNRTLEENEVPTIWIGNDIHAFNDYVRQRFKISLGVGYQPTLIRQDIWKHHLEENGLTLSDEEVLDLARKYQAAPRVIAHACEVASLSSQDIAAIEEKIQDQAALDYHGNRTGHNAQNAVPESYDIDFLQSPDDIDQTVRLFKDASGNERAVSFLIDGPRKTGKTSLANYMAEQSTRHVMSFDMDSLVRPTNQSEPVDHITVAFNAAAKADGILVVENFNLLFSLARDDDKEKMLSRFMDHMDDHRAPIVLINGATQDAIPEEFRAFVDHNIRLDRADGERLDKIAQKFLGRSMPNTKKAVAIGDFYVAARSLKRSGLIHDDNKLYKRLSAAANLSTTKRAVGLIPRATEDDSIYALRGPV